MTRTWQDDVAEFHRGTGLTVGEYPAIRDAETRARLIAEEAAETIAALGFHAHIDIRRPDGDMPWPLCDAVGTFTHEAAPSLPEVADGIADLIYVALGTAVVAGLDMGPIWNLVQRANMAKVEGGYRDETGKWRKPEGWQPPAVENEVAVQAITAADTLGVPFEVLPGGVVHLLFDDPDFDCPTCGRSMPADPTCRPGACAAPPATHRPETGNEAYCEGDGLLWPCPTVQAIEAAA